MFSRKLFSSSKGRRASDKTADTAPSSSSERSKSPGTHSTAKNERPGQDIATGVSLAHRLSSVGSTLPPPSRADTAIVDRTTDPLGLSLLYTPDGSHSADIVFVHGLGGSSRLTWCKHRRPELFWPQQWLPLDEDLENCRIFTFGYNAHFRSSSQSSAMGISDFSKNLLYDMLFGRDDHNDSFDMGKVPIIFVAHSMGGLVFKKAYLDAQLDARYAAIIDSISAVVFLSTPHRGSDLAPYLNRVLSMSFGSTSKQYVAELNEQAPFLRLVNEQFRHVANGLRIFSFYETLQSSVGVSSTLILEPESAKLGYPGEISRSLNANHYNVCKFENPQDPNYGAILGALKSLVAALSAHDVLPTAEEIENLRSSLSVHGSADHDFELFCGRRAESTCQWVLEQASVCTWLSSPSHSELLCIHGRPGRGKSVIAAFLTQHLQQQGAAVQYFFFRAGDESKRSMAAFIRSLVFQSAQQLPQFCKSLLELVSGGYRLKDAEWRSTWKKLFTNLLFEMEFDLPLYWVIDGLDEAHSPHHFFELLPDISGSRTPVRVLITSRWTSKLSTAFERSSSKVPTSVLSIDQDITDMRIYVKEELKFSNWGDELTEEVVQQILDRANDNFLWIHLVLEELKYCNTEDDIKERLVELPPGMDELYRRMEDTIVSIRRPSDRNLAQQLLTWAIHAHRSLTADELADVLEPSFGRILDISQTASRLCGHFIVTESDKIGLIHETAREYLTTTLTMPLSLSPEEAHGELFKQSITSFLDANVRSKLQRRSPILWNYRASSWPHHLAVAGMSGNGNEQLDMLTRFFTHPSVLVWIYILASLGQLKVLIDASRSLHSFIRRKRNADAANDPISRRFEDLENLDGWSRDLLKILGKFGSCLSQKPDSIYTDVVPFCPTASSIYRTFGSQHSNLLRIQGLSSEWDDCLARVSVGGEFVATLIRCSGRYLAVVNSVGSTLIWDCATFHQVNILKHGEVVSCHTFSTKGDRLATYGYRTTKVWDPQTGTLLQSIPNHTDMRALCLSFVDNDAALIMGSDRPCVLRSSPLSDESCTWKIIDAGLLSDTESFEGTYLNSPISLAVSPDGTHIAAAYRRFPMTVWSIKPAAPLRRIARTHKLGQVSKPLPFVSCISWHPGGDEIVGLFMDGCNFRMNIFDGFYQEQSPSPGQMPSDIACSPDGLVYAICGVGGTIRLFDYQTSTLIYQLSSEGMINAFSFSHDGRRFYDIRGSYCTVWEPNALMRLTAVDDDAAQSQAASVSGRQSQVVSESFCDSSVPIVLMSSMPRGTTTGFGDEEGAVGLFDYSTLETTRVGQTASRMRIEHLAWSESCERFCYVELGGRITIMQVEQTAGASTRSSRRVERFKPKFGCGDVSQVVFLPGSSSILLSFSSSAQLWSLEPAQMKVEHMFDKTQSSRKWIAHPCSPEHLLSITPEFVCLHNQHDLVALATWFWEDPAVSGVVNDGMLDSPGLPRNVAKPQDTSTIHEEVEDAYSTFLKGKIMIKVSRKTLSRRLRHRILMLDAVDIDPQCEQSRNIIRPIKIAAEVSHIVEMPLNVLSDGKMIFVDRSFWVCSWNLRSLRGAEDLQRHFFIPRDWLPVQSLGLLHVTANGSILCPRKGGISVITSLEFGSM